MNLEDKLNQLYSSHYFSKKLGKELFMSSTSKELIMCKRKIKKQIK